MNSKMNLITIILATITVTPYGKASCCSSTYDVANHTAITELQYKNTIDCSANQKCQDAMEQFIKVADSTTNKLPSIINKKGFKFSYNVSFNDN